MAMRRAHRVELRSCDADASRNKLGRREASGHAAAIVSRCGRSPDDNRDAADGQQSHQMRSSGVISTKRLIEAFLFVPCIGHRRRFHFEI